MTTPRSGSRAALALLFAIGFAADQASAQSVGGGPTPTPPRTFYRGGGNSNVGLGVGIGAAVGALAVGAIMSSQGSRGAPSMIETPPDTGPIRTYHSSQDVYVPPPSTGGHGYHKPRPHKVTRVAQNPPTNPPNNPPPPSTSPTPPPFPTGFVVPVRTELRYVPNEVLVITRGDVAGRLRSIESRLGLTSLALAHINLIDVDLRRYQLPANAVVGQTVASLRGQGAILGAEPNYLFDLQDDAAKPADAAPAPKAEPPVQYAVTSMRLDAAHRVATGDGVLVAVIDSGIDETNPDLQGAVATRFDALGGTFTPQEHGTAMAGSIVAHHTLVGVAPKARLLAIRAFAGGQKSARGTGFDILRGLDFAASNGAKIVNMSFAGPRDALLEQAIVAAHSKGVTLFAAAGNGGPTAKPFYPGAGPGVIAVTASDADGKPFAQANRGTYIAVAAPGVNVVAPGVGDGVRLSSGTSIATAEASGVAALILQKRASASPEEIKRILMSTARPLSSDSAASGAGVIDAAAAVSTIN